MRLILITTLLFLGTNLFSQGNLQFNQVLLVTVNSGQLTVPTGKVWKVTASSTESAVYYSNYSTNVTPTWSVTNPNPCNGATTGSTSVRRISKNQCPDANNKVIINGAKYSLNTSNPLWLPAGATVDVSSTPCVNTLSPGISANTPYYVRDQTDPGTTVIYYECDGPINQGAVSNGIILSVGCH